jgi:hypothetical protein
MFQPYVSACAHLCASVTRAPCFPPSFTRTKLDEGVVLIVPGIQHAIKCTGHSSLTRFLHLSCYNVPSSLYKKCVHGLRHLVKAPIPPIITPQLTGMIKLNSICSCLQPLILPAKGIISYAGDEIRCRWTSNRGGTEKESYHRGKKIGLDIAKWSAADMMAYRTKFLRRPLKSCTL